MGSRYPFARDEIPKGSRTRTVICDEMIEKRKKRALGALGQHSLAILDLWGPGSARTPSVQRLQWFTKGQYKAWKSGDQILLIDLRMGIEGSYIFNFEVAKREIDGIVTGSFAQLEQRPQLSRMTEIWHRIFDPSVELSTFSDRTLK